MSEDKYEVVYTIGCFDWFHHGHQIFFERIRDIGKLVVAGVHDDSSIEKLKNLSPSDHQDIKTRMANVKKFADIVYVIPDTDPTFFIQSVIKDGTNKQNSCYVRADDMPNFPGRHLVDEVMSIKFLPYTQGISSTKIREEHRQNK